MTDAAPTCCHSSKADVELVTHPLQPLTADEIRQVTTIVRRSAPYGEDTRFETIELLEPLKADVRQFVPGSRIRRSARSQRVQHQEDWCYGARDLDG